MDKKKKIENNKNVNNSLILNIYLGSYEGILYVFFINIITKNIENKFSFSTSQNAIRTIYHHNKILFVSGTDEVIHIYDIYNKKSEGDLVTYSGTINDIKICKNYLIAGGDESTIGLWRMSDFNNIINMKGHKSSINSIDIQENGAFCVSCGRDKNIIIFDLMTGIKIGKFELDYVCNKVELFHKSKYLLCVFDLHIFIFDLLKNSVNKEENIIQKEKFSKKIINAFFIKNKIIIFFVDGEINVFNINFDEKKEFIPFNKENAIKLNIEKPKKENENDLDLRVKFVSITKTEKIKILTIVFSNNDVYLYDLNKIIKYEKNNEKKIIKKYTSISNKILGKITAIDIEFSNKKI